MESRRIGNLVSMFGGLFLMSRVLSCRCCWSGFVGVDVVNRVSSLDTYPYYYSIMASFNAKRTSRKRIFAEEGKLSYVLSSFVFSLC